MKSKLLYLFLVFPYLCYTQIKQDSTQQSVKRIAILPFDISIQGISGNTFEEKNMLKTESINRSIELIKAIQGHSLYSDVDIISLDETVDILLNNGVELHTMTEYEPIELCKLLNVDEIVMGKFGFSANSVESNGGNQIGSVIVGLAISGSYINRMHRNSEKMYVRNEMYIYNKAGETVWEKSYQFVTKKAYPGKPLSLTTVQQLELVTKSLPFITK